MLKTNRKFIHLPLLVMLIFSVTLIGCSKNEGNFYDYQNPNAVFNGTTIEFLRSQTGIYDSLLYVLERANLTDTLSTASLTLFAAPNRSFDIAFENLNGLRAIQQKEPIYLSQVDELELDTILRRYILPGKITTDSISNLFDGRWYNSIGGHEMQLKYERQSASGYLGGGPQQIIFSDPKDSQFERYWVKSRTASVNITTRNGIVHLLLPSHEFAFGEATTRFNK